MATQVGFQLESSLASKHMTDAEYIKGGYIVVETTAERDALPIYDDTTSPVTDGIIVKGSLVYVAGTVNKSYRYDGTSWVEESGPAVGSLTTTSASSLSTASNESFGGSINLHKISKTGKYGDLATKNNAAHLYKGTISKTTSSAIVGTNLAEYDSSAPMATVPDLYVGDTILDTNGTYGRVTAWDTSLHSGTVVYAGDEIDIPTIPSNVITGSGTSGSITKFNGTNTVTDGPAFGSSTTTFLANDGQWRTPAGTVTLGTLDTNNDAAQTVPTTPESFDSNIDLHKISKTGSYSDLLNKPSDGSATIATVSSDVVTLKSGVSQSGLTISNSSGNDITLAKVAKTGAYGDLSGTPSIPTKTSDLTNDGDDGTHAFLATDDVVSTYSSSGTAPVNGTAVAAALATMPSPMVFKGTVGDSGALATIAWTTLLSSPTVSKVGDTYKVISAHNTAPICKVGDTIICTTGGIGSTSIWAVIPSGDEPGTVTSIGFTEGSGIDISVDPNNPITTSGTVTISHADTSTQASSTNSGRTYIQSVGLDDFGHVTSLSTGTETVVDTNTTYTLSGALSSHKFTSTLTAGGSGSGTSTAELTLDAGSNISLTDDTTNKKITIAATDTTYTFADGTTANTFKVTPSGGTAQTVNITPSVDASTQLTGVVPLDNGGTGISTTGNWYSNYYIHPHFQVIMSNDFYCWYLGPLDGITDVASALSSNAVKMALSSEVPVTSQGTLLFNGTIMTNALGGNPSRIFILFPDAVTFNGFIVNGLVGTLTYDVDGLCLSNVIANQPYWYTTWRPTLNYTASGLSASKTITSLSETDGVISATASNIAIDSTQTTRNSSNDATIASTDVLPIFDTSDSNKLKGSIAFGSTTTTFLANDGQWRTPAGQVTIPPIVHLYKGAILQQASPTTTPLNATLFADYDASTRTDFPVGDFVLGTNGVYGKITSWTDSTHIGAATYVDEIDIPTIDTTLSTSSNNAIANSTVATALGALEDGTNAHYKLSTMTIANNSNSQAITINDIVGSFDCAVGDIVIGQNGNYGHITSWSTDANPHAGTLVYDGTLNDNYVGSTANYAVYTTTNGQLTSAAALPTAITNATIAALPVWSATPTDGTYLIRQDTGGTSSFGRVPFSTVNSYIQTKNPALQYITYDSTEQALKFVFPS